MNAEFWLNLGIAGAVVAVVNLFLAYLRRERASCDACRSAHEEVTKEFGRIVSNHMTHQRESIEGLTGAIHELGELLHEMSRRPGPRK